MLVLVDNGNGTPIEADVAIPHAGRAVVDFGAGGNDARTVITGQTGITAQSVLLVAVLAEATSSRSADEAWLEPVVVRAGAIVPGVGFTIFARSDQPAPLFGAFAVAWQWS